MYIRTVFLGRVAMTTAPSPFLRHQALGNPADFRLRRFVLKTTSPFSKLSFSSILIPFRL